ncbi:MAG: histidine phosphatase family protein [Actinomycetota bacterium]
MYLYLVRHGQTDLNRDRRFRGLVDAPLNPEGCVEAEGAADILRSVDIPVVFSSPVERAMQTSRIIAVRTGSEVRPDERFTDVDYGAWQGLTVEEVRERFGDGAIQSWRSDPGSFTFPGGDSMADVRGRIEKALVQAAGLGPEHVAVVSHLAVLKVCFVAALDLPYPWFWRVNLTEGSVSVFSWRPGDGFTLEKWNETG